MTAISYTRTREVLYGEVVDLITGTGALSWPWWLEVSIKEDDTFTLVSWDGDREGGRKITTFTIQDVVDAVVKVQHAVSEDVVRDDFGVADAIEADLILQTLVFGEAVYG